MANWYPLYRGIVEGEGRLTLPDRALWGMLVSDGGGLDLDVSEGGLVAIIKDAVGRGLSKQKFLQEGAAAAAATVTVASGATVKKLAILQCDGLGVYSVKDGEEVLLAEVAKYPAPDAGNALLARLYTDAAPILDVTVAIGAIDNAARVMI